MDCATGAIELNGEAQTGMTASFTQGVTFAPVELLNHLEGYTATVQDSRIAIVTPNGEALTSWPPGHRQDRAGGLQQARGVRA